MKTESQAPAQHQGVAACRDIADDVLIGRIAARDPEAFTILYQRYAPRLAGFLHPQLAQPALVDDVLHETLMVVWQDAARFRGQAQLSTWILRIAQLQGALGTRGIPARLRVPSPAYGRCA